MWVLLLSCFFICNNTPLNSAIGNFATWYKTIPQYGMSISDLPEGIYNIGSYDVQQLADLPRRLVGRTIIIISGTRSSSEKIILLLNSNSGSMYFGYVYGSALTWKNVETTSTWLLKPYRFFPLSVSFYHICWSWYIVSYQ